MKKILVFAIAALSLLACQKKGGFPEPQQPASLLFPREDYSIDLSTGKSVLFDWETSPTGNVIYQVLFFKADDLKNPIYVISSDNNGFKPSLELPAATLDVIARTVGCTPGTESPVCWTVRTYSGSQYVDGVANGEIRTLWVKRANTFDLLSPADGISIFISEVESVNFSWSKPFYAGEEPLRYEILFSTSDNFNSPAYTISADDASVDVSAAQLGELWSTVAAPGTKNKQVFWTVRIIAGETVWPLPSSSRSFTLAPDIELPMPGAEITLRGEGTTDAGEKVTYMPEGYFSYANSKAGEVSPFNTNLYNYEVFASVTGGGKFYFETETGFMFTISGDQLVRIQDAANAQAPVTETGIYRIRFRLPEGNVYIQKVTYAGVFYCAAGVTSKQELTYEGMGKWKLEGFSFKWTNMGGWNDERYKFTFTIDEVQQQYGLMQVTDQRPSLSSVNPNYFYLTPAQVDQWDPGFKMLNDYLDFNENQRWSADLILYMNSDKGHYTHEFINPVDGHVTPPDDPGEGETLSLFGAAESGRTFNYIASDTFIGPVDAMGQTAGEAYNYEIFVNLTAGQPFGMKRGNAYFAISGTGKVVSIASESDAPTVVTTTGTYRIRVRMPDGDASILRVKKAEFRLCPTGYDEETLSYEGGGVFAMRNHSLNWQDTDWSWDHNADTRYKIWFTFETGDGDVEQAYGHNGTDESRAELSGEHLNIQPVPNTQWDWAKKIPYPIFEGKAHGSCFCDLEVYMNFSKQPGHYTQVWISR